jgi:hypothetical protein
LNILDQIYQNAGLSINSELRNRFEHTNTRLQQKRRGQHQYALKDFGLLPEQIDPAIRPYQRFMETLF